MVPSPTNNMSSFVSSFQRLMRSQRSAPSDHHATGLVPYVPRSLRESSMVLVRHDGVRRPLQAPYDGPYPVLEAGEKVFKILKNGLPYTVSVDRLKPCNLPMTPPFSSIIPNCNPPPQHPDDPSAPPRRRTFGPVPSPTPVPNPAPTQVPPPVTSRGGVFSFGPFF